MAAGMMRAEATKKCDLNTDTLMKTLGKYYQLRDDYNDLVPSTNVCLPNSIFPRPQFQTLMVNHQLTIIQGAHKVSETACNDLDQGFGANNFLDTTYNDLDQGSFTLPIIHDLEKEPENCNGEILSILTSRKWNGKKVSPEMKKLAVSKMEDMGSFTCTKDLLSNLHAEMEQEVELLEKRGEMGENWILRLMLYRLKVT